MQGVILGVDVGGTFTDAALLTADRLVTAKAPTTPEDQSEGVLAAVTEALDGAGARPDQVERFVHGMTVATNALLEGRVAAHGSARDRGLHGHRGAGTPGAGGALPALRLPPATARAR